VKYAYEDLSDEQFENLIVLLCQRLLGISVQGFAAGADGGRDAKFVGKAELHPSKADPWVGTTIVQAKHTNGYNRSFSESDFFSTGSAKTVVGKEIPRVRELRDKKEIDHYMLFANRRLTGIAESQIRHEISSKCKLPVASIYLCGLEQLDVWLKTFSEVVDLADLDPVDFPLTVSPDDLAEIVEAFARNSDYMSASFDNPPTPRVTYEHKNLLNNMSVPYARALRRGYLKDTAAIRTFLAAPENEALQQLYESVVEEFQLKIISKRKDYQYFDELMEYLVDLLLSRDAVLRQRPHRRLTRLMLFYMYWNCDIGQEQGHDAAAN
jgi:hypothetical protein